MLDNVKTKQMKIKIPKRIKDFMPAKEKERLAKLAEKQIELGKFEDEKKE